VIKGLIYVTSICVTIGLFVAMWATEGFHSLAAWHSKPVMPFVYGVLVLATTLGASLFTHRLMLCMAQRSNLELLGRGSISGLMIAVIWACLYLAHLLLKEQYPNYQPWLAGIGLAMALPLGCIGLVEESFLRENLVALGYVLAVVGGLGFPLYPLPGQCLAAGGITLVLTTTLVTGRFRFHSRHQASYEISRQENPIQFWMTVMVLSGLIGFIMVGPVFYPKQFRGRTHINSFQQL
jgi:hypothetical protein